MSKIHIQTEIDTVLLLQGAAQMTIRELENFVTELNGLITRKKTKSKVRQEKRLLAKINQSVLNPLQRQRYQILSEQFALEIIQPTEYAELLLLANEDEALRNERVQSMIELAQLKAISLPQLMQELGLKPIQY
ncbi:MAG: hypothetical protein RL329_1489 [Bacteroidota bacterium]|jgi:hypothetical protein